MATCKHDVTNKTGSIKRIATPPEEDRATAIGQQQEEAEQQQQRGYNKSVCSLVRRLLSGVTLTA